MSSQPSKIAMSPEKLFLVKLIMLCLFSAFALTLCFLNIISVPCLVMIVAGGLWNFFGKINSYFGFALCLITSTIAGLLCIGIGLYSNAVLYLIFYIALQIVVLVLNMKGNTIFVRYKRLDPRESYFISLSFLLFAVSGFAISLCQNNMIIPAIDSVSATLLALSAYLHSRNFKEYYVIRPIALLLEIGMFAYLLSIGFVTSSVIAFVFLYSMYFVLDCLEHIFLFQSKYKTKHSIRNVFAKEEKVKTVENASKPEDTDDENIKA